jgi:D-lactate dehydrogenase (cytochrome)
VPVYKIPEFVESAADKLARDYPGVEVVIVGHIGDGNLHYIVMHSRALWERTADKPAYQERLANDLYDIAVRMGGTFSAEHGVGVLHLPEMVKYKDPVEISLMWQVKNTLDPKGIMNPGRVLPAPGG